MKRLLSTPRPLPAQIENLWHQRLKDPVFASILEPELPAEMFQVADHIKRSFTDLLIIGVGGSSLGGQSFYALNQNSAVKLHFFENLDPYVFSQRLQRLDPKKTGVLVISKSGNTAEVLVQFLVSLDYWRGLPLSHHFFILSEPKENALSKITHQLGLGFIPHPLDIGGRFSCFTPVGLLPALVADVDVGEVLKGAQKILTDPDFSFVASLYDHVNRGYGKTVLMPYVEPLSYFSSWWRQLWAESLGKDGKGLTPLTALGPVDQHSQLQLYLGGPQDKYFTLIFSNPQGKGHKINDALLPELSYFEGKTIGDLVAAQQKATYETLKEQGCPVRLITFDELTPHVLGQLLASFMMETVLMGDLMGIDPYGQPAVESSKKLAIDYLCQSDF